MPAQLLVLLQQQTLNTCHWFTGTEETRTKDTNQNKLELVYSLERDIGQWQTIVDTRVSGELLGMCRHCLKKLFFFLKIFYIISLKRSSLRTEQLLC